MKKVFFGKWIDKNEQELLLGNDFSCDFVPLISIEKLNVPAFPLSENTLLFSSENAVIAFLDNHFEVSEKQKVIAIGSKTEKALLMANIHCVACFPNAEDAATFLLEHPQENKKIVHFCSQIALDVLQKKLENSSILYQQQIIYHTHLTEPIINEKYDMMVFFSPSGVHSFAKNNRFGGQLIALGENTKKTLQQYSPLEMQVAKSNELKEIIQLIKERK